MGQIREYVWSGDSRFIAYTSPGLNFLNAIRLYALETGQVTPVSSGLFETPARRSTARERPLFRLPPHPEPQFGAFEFDFQFEKTDKIYAVTLRAGAASPVAPQSDEETGEAKEGGKEGKEGKEGRRGKGRRLGQGRGREARGACETLGRRSGGSGRARGRDPGAGRALRQPHGLQGEADLQEVDPPAGAPDDPGSFTGTIHLYDLEKRKDSVVIAGVALGYAASKTARSFSTRQGRLRHRRRGGREEGGRRQAGGGGDLDGHGGAAQEWMQMFNEPGAWSAISTTTPNGRDRLEGDGRALPAAGAARGAPLRPELHPGGADLRAVHVAHLRGGGDAPQPAKSTSASWARLRSRPQERSLPLQDDLPRRRLERTDRGAARRAGHDVREGDYLLAVNGQPVKAPQNSTPRSSARPARRRDHRRLLRRRPSRATFTASRSIARCRCATPPGWGQPGPRVQRRTAVAYIHVPDTPSTIQEFTKQ